MYSTKKNYSSGKVFINNNTSKIPFSSTKKNIAIFPQDFYTDNQIIYPMRVSVNSDNAINSNETLKYKFLLSRYLKNSFFSIPKHSVDFHTLVIRKQYSTDCSL